MALLLALVASITLPAGAIVLTVSPGGLTNDVMVGNTPTSRTFNVINADTNTADYTVTISNSWLSCSSNSGTLAGYDTNILSLSYSSTVGWTPGASNTVITVASTNDSGATQTVTVVLNVMELELSPVTLTAAVMQEQNASNQTFTLVNSGAGNLAYTIVTNVAWLSVSNVSGVLTGQTAGATNTITVRFLTSGLGVGPYAGAITSIPALGGGSKVVDVNLTVKAKPELVVDPGVFEVTVVQGQSVADQIMTISNTSAEGYAFGYTVAADTSWLSMTGPYGSGSTITGQLAAGAVNAITVSCVGVSGFSVGTYNGILTVTATDSNGVMAIGSPANVGVQVVVSGFGMGVSPSSLLSTVLQGYNAATQQLEVWKSGISTNTLRYQVTDNVNWLMVVPSVGVSTGEHDTLEVRFSTTGLNVGTSNAVIEVVGLDDYGNSISTSQVPVSMIVKPLAVLGCDGVSMGVTNRQGQGSISRSFTVWNDSVAPKGGLSWTVSANVSWLRVSPVMGQSTGERVTTTVGFDVTGLSPGSYRGLVIVDGVDELSGGTSVQSPTEIEMAICVEGTKGLDFFGDGIGAELVVYGDVNGWWQIKRFSDGCETNVWFGGEGYQPVPGDYNGDGRVDLAVYRAAGAVWYVKALGSDTISELRSWGGIDYEAVVGDYDGDGHADYALYAENSGMWYILKSSDGGVLSGQFGGPGYKAMAGDFDGDEVADAALYDTRSGNWYIIKVNGVVIAWNLLWGGEGFTPIVGDYDGDGHMDVGAYHEETGLWFAKSVEGDIILWWVPWGAPGYKPVSGDYNEDGLTELSVYQRSSGLWFIRTVGGTIYQQSFPWGGPSYIPVGQ